MVRAVGRGWRATPVSARVGVALAVTTVVVALIGQSANGHRNNALAHSETQQAAAVITSSLNDASSAIDALSDTLTVTNGSTVAFAAQAQGLVHGPMSAAFGKIFLGRYGIAAAVGNAYRTGQVLDSSLTSSLQPKSTANPGPSVILGHNGIVTFAAGPPFVPAGEGVLVQVDLNEVVAAMTSSEGAFDGVELTLYGSATPEPATAVVSSGPTATASALTASAVVTAGPDAWLLVVRAPGPLVGAFAAATPVIVLILGLAVAVLSTALVEIAARRRRGRLSAATPVTPEPVVLVPEPAAAPEPEPAVSAEPAPVAIAAPEAPEPDPPPSGVMTRPVTTTLIPEVPASVARPQPPASESPTTDPVAAGAAPGAVAMELPAAAPPPSPERRRITLVREDAADAGDDGPVFQDADWRPDPSGRYELRRYVAGQPTSLVRSGDAEQYDDVSALVERGPAPHIAVRPAAAPPPMELVRPAPPAVLSAYDAAGRPLQVDQDADAVIDTLVARVTQSIASELKERGDDGELPWAVGDDSY